LLLYRLFTLLASAITRDERNYSRSNTSLFQYSIQQAVILIAQLGGLLARRHDGFPGVKTLWKGLQRLHDIASTWKLIYSSKNHSL